PLIGRRLLGLALGASLGVLLALFGATFARVGGNSMAPSLSDGDLVVLLRPPLDALLGRRDGYLVGDVLALQTPTGASVKRLVAVGPVTVAMADGLLLIDGEPSVVGSQAGYESHSSLEPTKVPAGELFVVGDNRRPLASNDSRNYGAVSPADVRGRLVLNLGWPG